MRETAEMNLINDHISHIRAYLVTNTAMNLNDGALGLEIFYRDVLSMAHNWKLESANYRSPNASAIDLFDPEARLAVQVAVNVSAKKIRATVKKFISADLSSKYDRLVLVGIDRVAKVPDDIPVWVEAWKPAEAFTLSRLNLDELIALRERIEQSVDIARFGPSADFHCFDVVLTVLDRDAIRHGSAMEGSWPDATEGLKQIRKVVTDGALPEKGIKAKPRSRYRGDDYQDILLLIDRHVSRMLAILNEARMNDAFYNLEFEALREMDQIRTELSAAVNAFSSARGHRQQIQLVRSRAYGS